MHESMKVFTWTNDSHHVCVKALASSCHRSLPLFLQVNPLPLNTYPVILAALRFPSNTTTILALAIPSNSILYTHPPIHHDIPISTTSRPSRAAKCNGVKKDLASAVSKQVSGPCMSKWNANINAKMTDIPHLYTIPKSFLRQQDIRPPALRRSLAHWLTRWLRVCMAHRSGISSSKKDTYELLTNLGQGNPTISSLRTHARLKAMSSLAQAGEILQRQRLSF